MRDVFLRLKWKINERARVRDAYYSVRSIKEIFQKKEEIYEKLLEAERKEKSDREIGFYEGALAYSKWLFSELGDVSKPPRT